MSTYPFWSLSFPIRPDVDPATLRVLTAVASDVAPNDDDLERLHPVLRYYLADWSRLLADALPPFIGPPIRLSHDRRAGPHVLMSIEFSQHDDEFADGGWVFWTWVLRLVERPEGDPTRSVIGCHGLYRNDYDTRLIYVDSNGVLDGDTRISFDDLDTTWNGVVSDQGWEGWPL